MKHSAPRHITWWVALIAGGVGVLEYYRVIHLPVVGSFSMFLIAGSWLLLILATALRGL